MCTHRHTHTDTHTENSLLDMRSFTIYHLDFTTTAANLPLSPSYSDFIVNGDTGAGKERGMEGEGGENCLGDGPSEGGRMEVNHVMCWDSLRRNGTRSGS